MTLVRVLLLIASKAIVKVTWKHNNLIDKENKSNKLEYCPIIAGVSFLDQVRSLESLSEIKFESIAFPILFLPFVSRASEIVGRKILLKVDNRTFLLNYNTSIYSNVERNITNRYWNICKTIIQYIEG